jgi:hypothetical protein
MGIGLVHVESIKIMRERQEQKTRPLLYAFLRSPPRLGKKLLPKKEILRSKPGPDHRWRKSWKKKFPWIKKPLTDIFTEQLT